MAEKKIQTQFYQVNAPFYWQGEQLFTAGQVVAAGHPVLKGRRHLFRPIEPISMPPSPPEPEPESATDAPSEPEATGGDTEAEAQS